METEEDVKIRKILKKVNKDKPQFGLGQVPQYVKSRSGRENGGFIKKLTYNRRNNKQKNRGKTKIKKEENLKNINLFFLVVLLRCKTTMPPLLKSR